MGYECFEVDRVGAVAHLRLSRPDALNTMTPRFWRELPDAVRSLGADGGTRVIVLSSTGRHFSAGMDLSVFTAGALTGEPTEPSESREPNEPVEPSERDEPTEPGRANATRRLLVRALQEAISAVEQVRVPVLAAVQGGCIGGALDLATACDARYATADAFFVVQETNLGMTADVGTLQRLPKLIPDGVARELVYTGRRLPAARAREVGLVNEVYPDQQTMLAAVGEIAAEIAARSPLAVWGCKEALVYARDHSVRDSLDQVATWQAGAFQPADLTEAFAARAARRDPVYRDLPAAPDGL